MKQTAEEFDREMADPLATWSQLVEWEPKLAGLLLECRNLAGAGDPMLFWNGWPRVHPDGVERESFHRRLQAIVGWGRPRDEQSDPRLYTSRAWDSACWVVEEMLYRVNPERLDETPAPSIGAIPTTYRDVQFRSRTEARWAVFFDGLELSWEHEPNGYALDGGWYIPDFWMPGLKCFWEVKGVVGQGSRKASELAELTGMPVYIVVGVPRAVRRVEVFLPGGGYRELALPAVFPGLDPRAVDWAADKATGHRFWDPK